MRVARLVKRLESETYAIIKMSGVLLRVVSAVKSWGLSRSGITTKCRGLLFFRRTGGQSASTEEETRTITCNIL